MPAPGAQSTWDGNPNTSPPTTTPYRPGSADFNGIGLQDRADFPPNAQTMPTANLLNTWSATEVVLGRIVPNMVLSITGGNPPSIALCTAAPTAVNGNPSGFLTLTRNGAGDVSITWPANTFPPAVAWPMATVNTQQGPTDSRTIAATPITNGVRVTTFNGGGGVDMNFTVSVY